MADHVERLISRTAPPPAARPELGLTAGCACRQPRCAMTGPCLETELADERYGVWARGRRRHLRLAS